MRIEVDGTDYDVSMKWEMDDTIRHFVTIDEELYELDIPSRMVNDGKMYIRSDEFRIILAKKIQDTIDNRARNGRA